MTANEIVQELKKQTNPKNIAGMARFGISGKNVLGVSIPVLRKMAKDIKKSKIDHHKLALELWATEIHEVRILASMIDLPQKVTASQMDNWTRDFDSWDVCDQVCMNLFDKTEFSFDKCIEWSNRTGEFEKRAGFALMAAIASHRKDLSDEKIAEFLPYILKNATDDRNFVRKAVNWALRGIGKRNKNLEKKAIKTADEIMKIDDKTTKWIAGDALREFDRRNKR